MTTAPSLSATEPTAPSTGRLLLNKVPEVTALFWVVKILSTTVGETAADFLAGNLGLGLTNTSLVMLVLFGAALAWQKRTTRYVPTAYWLTVVLVSVVGTLLSDNLVDNFGVSLWTTTAVFSVVLAAVFTTWWRSERTLSIHTITSGRRENFYWAAILATFALGTSAGDLVSEKLALGYLPSAGMFGLLIALVGLDCWRGGINPVLAFWTAYVLTRPFGASIGDFLTSSTGGLGLGTNLTSGVFLAVIVGAVGWFSLPQGRSSAAAVPVADVVG